MQTAIIDYITVYYPIGNKETIIVTLHNTDRQQRQNLNILINNNELIKVKMTTTDNSKIL